MKYAFGLSLAVAVLAGLIATVPAQAQPYSVPTTAAASVNAGPPKIVGTGSAAMLTNAKGMTLYVYDKDAAGKSTCTGACAANWPPLAAAASDKASGKWTIVTRDDGSLQWGYDGKPVYGWKNDKAPGDTTGDGVAGSWHVARP